MILSDKSIIHLAETQNLISPFIKYQVKENNGKKTISYGLSSFGYDVRAAPEFKIFKNKGNNNIIDPKDFDDNNTEHIDSDICIIPPNGFALGRTIEYFKIPKDVLALCVGKSTYARCGILINVTPIEPDYEGHIVLEFSNTTPFPGKIYANEGVCQFLFFKGDQNCGTSYLDRKGKYMYQKNIVLPKL